MMDHPSKDSTEPGDCIEPGDRIEPGDCAETGNCKACTPRLMTSPAMMSRWISDVPSQIRSTRSSRYRRSTGYDRSYPRPPKICTHRSTTRPAASDADSLAMDALACRVLR